VPNYRALYLASNALSEWLAIAWYRLRYRRGASQPINP